MFRPVLNGRSIIQMIDPARDFRGMGRQVTRTGRHMRVMFSAESGADPRSNVARSGFRNDAFNYDFYAFHDIDTRLFPPPPPVPSIRTVFLDSFSRIFFGLFCVDGNGCLLAFNCFAREARLLSSFLFPFFPFF